MEEAAGKATMEEDRRRRTQEDLQNRYQLDLEREKMVTGGGGRSQRGHRRLKKHEAKSASPSSRVCSTQVRQQVEEQMAQKSSELEQYLQRVRELEDMYRQLEEALEDERQAKLDEEAMRRLQAR